MSFANQVVWITGSSSGIGRQLAVEFARQGATVAVSARRLDLLSAVVAEIESTGGKAKAFQCDVLIEKNIEQCANDIVSYFGKLDVAVANAGFGVVGKIESLNDADWNRQMAVNVTGLVLTAKYAIPHLRKTKGRLSLIGSVAAFLPNPNTGAYGASKAAVHSIGETLQIELIGSGISCTTIHPGFVESNIARVDNSNAYHSDFKDPRPANLMWTAEKAAKAMVTAIRRRKKVFVFTFHGKIGAFLGRHFPVLTRKLVAKFNRA